MTTPAEAVDTPDEPPHLTPARRREPLARGPVRLARPRQWVKNLLVFVAPGAAGVLLHPTVLWHAAAAFGIFCLAASGTYYLDDARVMPRPTVGIRPSATARWRPVSCPRPRSPSTLGVVMMAASVGLGAWLAGWHLSVVMAAYVAVQLAYSFGLKNEPILDLACVSAGLHPAGDGRRCGHLGPPVQLVPHRGVLRVPPGCHRQALRGEAAAGRGRRPTRRPSARPSASTRRRS